MRGSVATSAVLFLLSAAALLAGCSDAPVATDEPAFDALDLQATETTGVIRGVVVDEAVRPVAGASVKLVTTGAETTSGADGLFGFSALDPGTHFLEITRLGFFPAQQSTEVVAQVAEPPIVKVLLTADVSYVPYANLLAYDGWIECTTSFLVLCGAPNTLEPIFCEGFHEPPLPPFPPVCYGNLTNDRFTWNFYYDANITWLQTEMAWDSTQAFSPELTLEMETLDPDCEDDDYLFHGSGPSPILWSANASVLEDSEMIFGPDCPVYHSIFSGDTAGTPLGFTLEQRFKAFSAAFYQYTPPEGWSFVETGALPPPPV